MSAQPATAVDATRDSAPGHAGEPTLVSFKDVPEERRTDAPAETIERLRERIFEISTRIKPDFDFDVDEALRL